jgi:putative membrane protein
MKGVLIRWVLSAIALYLTAVLAGVLNLGIVVKGAPGALLAVVALAIVNALIRPLILLLTLPLNCLTLGLFTFLVNALMFWLVGAVGIPGFEVHSFLAAVFGSIVMGIISGLVNHFVAPKEK